MSRKLVAYFSATGTTAAAAKKLADGLGAELYEIKPQVPYVAADLDWMDANSRSTIEMKDLSSRPALLSKDADLEGVDEVYLGFPIWWYVAPTIINSFLESYDFTGKKIILFATSGGSGFGKTLERLRPSCPGADISLGKIIKSQDAAAEIAAEIAIS